MLLFHFLFSFFLLLKACKIQRKILVYARKIIIHNCVTVLDNTNSLMCGKRGLELSYNFSFLTILLHCCCYYCCVKINFFNFSLSAQFLQQQLIIFSPLLRIKIFPSFFLFLLLLAVNDSKNTEMKIFFLLCVINYESKKFPPAYTYK